ncbi:Do family serine endopeptidase [Liberibacter crescens]|uniref:Do family serine endopeptidase n=1 Tax=Liberibacter crescens TaxID=1273132 RepID=UPI000763193A|nr:serine peptidase [Liberibacter crescens]
MFKIKNQFMSSKFFFKFLSIALLAMVVSVSGWPIKIADSFALPVISGPQIPSFAPVVDAVYSSVVSVRVQSKLSPVSDKEMELFDFYGFDDLPDDHPLSRFFRDFGLRKKTEKKSKNAPLRPIAQGSGFFVSEDGYIVTNNHVIADGSSFIIVLNDGTELPAKLVGKDTRTDLAVLKVNDKRKFVYAEFGDDNVRVGDWVLAVGNPFGLGGTVTAGIVSNRSRHIGSGIYDDYIQIDAAVNRGNSGGPTFNLKGQVIGVNTAIVSNSGGTNLGIAFAIPASTAKEVVSVLIKKGKIDRGWLGVHIQNVTKEIAESLGFAEQKGVFIAGVEKDSPAGKYGIKEGDIISAIENVPVKDVRDLALRVASLPPGKKVELTVWHAGQEKKSVFVKLGTFPTDPEKEIKSTKEEEDKGEGREISGLGIKVISDNSASGGLSITSVDENSEAAEKGIKEGMRIISVNNSKVSSVEDIEKILNLSRKKGRKNALFQIEFKNGSNFIPLKIIKE